MNQSFTATCPKRGEEGTALILAMFLGVLAVGITVSGTQYLRASRTQTETTLMLAGQCREIAKSGLSEALNWFRLQPSQPVRTFDPQRDDLADPQIFDTEEPDIGLVRNYQVNGSLWGRSEVWKQWDADPDPNRLAWRQKMQALDVSDQRKAAPGSVWRLQCVAYVYRRVDPSKAYNEAPNVVLATEVHQAEIRRLNLTPPAAAALSVQDGDTTTIGDTGVVDGGGRGAGVAYGRGSAPGSRGRGRGRGRMGGAPPAAPIPSYDDSVESVFDVKQTELRGLADMAVTEVAEFPVTIPKGALIYSEIDGLTLARPAPLTGFGVLYHEGDLVLEGGTNFSGILYANGDLTVISPSEIRGTVIATGAVDISGASDLATLMYDPDAIAELQQAFGEYRFSTPIRVTN